jgi:hypothetical protein
VAKYDITPNIEGCTTFVQRKCNANATQMPVQSRLKRQDITATFNIMTFGAILIITLTLIIIDLIAILALCQECQI